MDLSTTYLGLRLSHPILPGASPLVDDLDMVRRLEDAGAPAIVMHSLFEEQIDRDRREMIESIEGPADSYAEALSYLPQPAEFALGPDQYLIQIQRIKQAVEVPVIASLNGVTPSGWTEWAGLIQEAGADALELNIYLLATDPGETGELVERRALETVRAVRRALSIPLAVKLSPFFSSLPNMAARLEEAGADGLVLFNRFYQPEIDVEELEVVPTLHLSDPSELLLRLRWVAILAGRLRCSLAVTGGVHGPIDAVRSIMAGADAVQTVSALLRHGPERLGALRDGLARWLEEHGYESVARMKGSMSLLRCPEPAAFERANYMKVLMSRKAGSRA